MLGEARDKPVAPDPADPPRIDERLINFDVTELDREGLVVVCIPPVLVGLTVKILSLIL